MNSLQGNFGRDYEDYSHLKASSCLSQKPNLFFMLLLLLLLSHFSRVRLCDPRDGSPPGSPVPGMLQAETSGVSCHFLLQCMKVKSESEVAQSCLTLSHPMDSAY